MPGSQSIETTFPLREISSRQARREAAPFPRAALLRAQIAERQSQPELALKLLRLALDESPALLQEELTHLLNLAGDERRDTELAALAKTAQSRSVSELKSLVFAAVGAGLASAAPLRPAIEAVFLNDPALAAMWRAAGGELERVGEPSSARCSHTPSDTAARSADSRHAAFIGIVRRANRGKVSIPTRWSNCVENPL